MENVHKSFLIYKDWYQEFLLLDLLQRGQLFTAVFCWAVGDPLPEMDREVELIFSIWRRFLQMDAEKWKETARKRSEAGRKGGQATARNRAMQMLADYDPDLRPVF